MSKRITPELLLSDIIESGEKILRYTSDMTYEEFVVIRQNKWRIKKVFNFAAKKHG